MTTRALSGAVAAGLAATFLVACGHENEKATTPPGTATQPAAARTLYQDTEGRFSIRYPAGWIRATESLTPHLSDPREIVSIGTYTMRPGGELCEHLPANALEDIGPEDAFLSIEERAAPHLAVYPARPTQFTLGKPNEDFDGVGCVRDPNGLLQWWLSFRDGSRAFYALVALGKSASEETRQQLVETLNSFQVDG
jgi:hypothetical protein